MKHEIKTIEDILRVITPENMEAFITDFRMFLTTARLVDAVGDAIGQGQVGKRFVWVDDGKHDMKSFLKKSSPH